VDYFRHTLPITYSESVFLPVGFYSSPRRPHRLCGPHNLLFNDTGVLSGMVKGPGLEFDHSSTCSTNIKNEWSYTSPPSIRLHCVDM